MIIKLIIYLIYNDDIRTLLKQFKFNNNNNNNLNNIYNGIKLVYH